jgi:hypothetical protein
MEAGIGETLHAAIAWTRSTPHAEATRHWGGSSRGSEEGISGRKGEGVRVWNQCKEPGEGGQIWQREKVEVNLWSVMALNILACKALQTERCRERALDARQVWLC